MSGLKDATAQDIYWRVSDRQYRVLGNVDENWTLNAAYQTVGGLMYDGLIGLHHVRSYYTNRNHWRISQKGMKVLRKVRESEDAFHQDLTVTV